jgi:hypothetical protein
VAYGTVVVFGKDLRNFEEFLKEKAKNLYLKKPQK